MDKLKSDAYEWAEHRQPGTVLFSMKTLNVFLVIGRSHSLATHKLGRTKLAENIYSAWAGDWVWSADDSDEPKRDRLRGEEERQ